MRFFNNGYIVQNPSYLSDLIYSGVEGNNWVCCENDKELKSFFDAFIDVSWQYDNYVDCCSDESFVLKCVNYCKKNNIPYRVLFCKSTCSNPTLDSPPRFNAKFIGYDYAYAGGSYYSCVKNDLIYRKIIGFEGIKINKNGLLMTEADLKKFMETRKVISKFYSDNLFEIGNFIPYKLYLIDQF